MLAWTLHKSPNSFDEGCIIPVIFFSPYSPKVLGMWYWGPVSGIFQTVTFTGGMGSLMHPLASSMLMVAVDSSL